MEHGIPSVLSLLHCNDIPEDQSSRAAALLLPYKPVSHSDAVLIYVFIDYALEHIDESSESGTATEETAPSVITCAYPAVVSIGLVLTTSKVERVLVAGEVLRARPVRGTNGSSTNIVVSTNTAASNSIDRRILISSIRGSGVT